MPGLVPGIYAEPTVHSLKHVRSGAAWMAGTSPAMTSVGRIEKAFSRATSAFHFPRTALPQAGEEGHLEIGAMTNGLFSNLIKEPRLYVETVPMSTSVE